MNTTPQTVSPLRALRALATGAGLCLTLCAWGADGPSPGQVREEAQRLEEKARDLKAAGQDEEAQRAMREVRKLRASVDRKVPENPERPAVMARRQELRARMGELKLQFRRAEEAGREAEATELRQQIERLGRELSRAEAMPQGPRPGQREGLRRPEMPGPPDPAQRMEHVRRAIENLRAAGLPWLAERLEQGAWRLQERPGRTGMRGGPPEPIERLQGEVRELRQAMQEMKRRLEEVARRQPRPEGRGER